MYKVKVDSRSCEATVWSMWDLFILAGCSKSESKGCPTPPDSSDSSAARLEREHVLQVYDQIAEHFSVTRHKPWPQVLEVRRNRARERLLMARKNIIVHIYTWILLSLWNIILCHILTVCVVLASRINAARCWVWQWQVHGPQQAGVPGKAVERSYFFTFLTI